MSDYEFVDELPPSRKGRDITADVMVPPIVEACKANPGRWMVLESAPRTERGRLAARGQYLKKQYGLNNAVRADDAGICTVYVSYQNGAES